MVVDLILIRSASPSYALHNSLKMKSLKTIKFQSPIVRDHSSSSILEELGSANCSMELLMDDDNETGQIEWIIEYENGSVDVEHIGLWFDNRSLTDYDDVFSLPEEAIN